MITEEEINHDRELTLLEEIERDPDVNQATLATQLGVAVGTANWLIKRLIEKGYVKVKKAQRRKLRYIITPEGLSYRAWLTVNYVENSMHLYRKTRQRVREILVDVKQSGYDQVRIEGEGDIADICKLTCLEQGIKVIDRHPNPLTYNVPVLEVRGIKIFLHKEVKEAEVIYE